MSGSTFDTTETERFVREALSHLDQTPDEKTVKQVAFKIDKAFRFLVKGEKKHFTLSQGLD